MFTSRLVTLAFVLVFAIINVMAMPLPLELRAGNIVGAHRDLVPFTPIRAYMKRDGMWESDYGRRDPDDVPEEVATEATDGNVRVFGSRQNGRRDPDDVPEEVATEATDGNVRVFGSRQNGRRSVGRGSQ